MSEAEFIGWPSIPRGQQEEITITEKIDGTNACIIIDELGEIIGVQSRKRLITIHDDNFGFANWVLANREDLSKLGAGYHYGEWAGEGIQKNHHGIVGRKFLLFNTFRWNPQNPNRPDCCDVVPILYEGLSSPDIIEDTMNALAEDYKQANAYHNSLLKPEGVVVWFHKSRRYEKYTFDTPNGKWTANNDQTQS